MSSRVGSSVSSGVKQRQSARISQRAGRRQKPAAVVPPDSRPRRRRRTRGQQFSITVDLNLAYALRAKIRREFVAIFLGLVEFACAMERSETLQEVDYDEYEDDEFLAGVRRRLSHGAGGGAEAAAPAPMEVVAQRRSSPTYHLHCYIKLRQSVYLEGVRKKVAAWANGLRYDVQFCECRDKWLNYIWKQDAMAYTNVRLPQQGFLQKAWHWANSTPQFSSTDPFVRYYRWNAKFLQAYHAQRRQERLARAFPGLRPVTEYHPPLDSWTGECARWWNEWHATFRHYRPCLYLWGPHDVGKTTWITQVIGGTRMMPYVFLPGVGQFFMTSFRSMIHKVILFKEFDETLFNCSMLRRLMEGAPYAYPVRFKDDLRLEFEGPIIFVSNRSETQLSEGLRCRLHVVHAATPYWKHEHDGMIALPAVVASQTNHRPVTCNNDEPIAIASTSSASVDLFGGGDSLSLDETAGAVVGDGAAADTGDVGSDQYRGMNGSNEVDERGDYDSDEWDRMNVESDRYYTECVRQRQDNKRKGPTRFL